MKTRILKFGLFFLFFGFGNFLLIFFYYLLYYGVPLVLLVPFGGSLSGNVPEPMWSVLLSNEILENIGQRLGSSITIMDFNNDWPFSIWEMSWSISLYLGTVLLSIWYFKSRKNNNRIKLQLTTNQIPMVVVKD